VGTCTVSVIKRLPEAPGTDHQAVALPGIRCRTLFPAQQLLSRLARISDFGHGCRLRMNQQL